MLSLMYVLNKSTQNKIETRWFYNVLVTYSRHRSNYVLGDIEF